MSEKVKVYKVELLIVDHDQCGADEIQTVIENQRYPNRCISPSVMDIEEREVEWSDNCPLNLISQTRAEYERLFKS